MKTIIFDFDGTIADTLKRLVQIYNETAPRFGCRTLTSADLERVRNGRPKDFMREFGISYFKLPVLLWAIRKKLKGDIAELKLQEGVRDSLLELRERDTSLHILTSNSKENVEVFLRVNNLENIFQSIISHGSLFGKHMPLSDMKKLYSDITYVGDEVRDIEAAQRARVKSVAVTWGFQTENALLASSPDFIVHRPKELLNLA